MDDHLLLDRVRARDERAFAELRTEYHPHLLARIEQVVGNLALSEEIAQDVWLYFWEHASDVDLSKGSLRSWLTTIGHRRAVDCVRSVQAARDRDRLWGHRNEAEPGLDVEHRLSILVRRPALEVAWSLLPEHQRTVIALRHFEDMTHPEIAQRLGLPLGTGKSRYRDGLIRLRQLMSDQELVA